MIILMILKKYEHVTKNKNVIRSKYNKYKLYSKKELSHFTELEKKRIYIYELIIIKFSCKYNRIIFHHKITERTICYKICFTLIFRRHT